MIFSVLMLGIASDVIEIGSFIGGIISVVGEIISFVGEMLAVLEGSLAVEFEAWDSMKRTCSRINTKTNE